MIKILHTNFENTNDPYLYLEMNGKKYTYYIDSKSVCISYHPFGTKRFVTKWITSEKTLAPIFEFATNYLESI